MRGADTSMELPGKGMTGVQLQQQQVAYAMSGTDLGHGCCRSRDIQYADSYRVQYPAPATRNCSCDEVERHARAEELGVKEIWPPKFRVACGLEDEMALEKEGDDSDGDRAKERHKARIEELRQREERGEEGKRRKEEEGGEEEGRRERREGGREGCERRGEGARGFRWSEENWVLADQV
eukprot:2443867-Rhodomonas_salina.1